MGRIRLASEPTRKDMSLVAVLQALSDEVRLGIVLEIVRAGELACGKFASSSPKSTLSHHFRVLREAGILSTRRNGKEWINSVRRADLDARFPGLFDSIIAAALKKK